MRTILEMTLMSCIAICFCMAALEDHRTCLVRRYWWWLSGGAGTILLILKRGILPAVILELVFFGVIQFLLFSRAYGKADCHAFFCSAIVLAAHGGGLREFLWQELLTFMLLGMVQLIKRNVNAKGNLKRPVPLIPYVLPVFFLMLLFMRFKITFLS